mgnify:CR=1 FL=1
MSKSIGVIKLKNDKHNISVGRRKSSVARVFYKNGSGKIIVNDGEVLNYFKRESLVMMLSQPLDLVQFNKKYDFVVNSNAKVNPVVESSLILSFNPTENILKALVQSLKGIPAR